MILQALNDYYRRLQNDPEANVPEPGFSRQGIHFCLILDREGHLVGDPLDLRNGKNAKQLTVPQAVKRSVGISANFMWDNTGYVLGADSKGKPERAMETFTAFKELHHAVGDSIKDEGMQAVLKFLDSWDPELAAALPLWEEMVGLNLVFRLDGDLAYVHERPEVKTAWLRHFQSNRGETTGMCLVTGEEDLPLSRLHAAIKGVPGTQTSGAALVSFNLKSFESFGKTQNLNAPVGEKAAFSYTTALNHLLVRDNFQRVQIGDATTVFWTEKASSVESIMAGLIDPGILESAPDQLQQELRVFLESISKETFPREFDQPDNRFFILGLSPNAARISVRFWHVSTVGEMAARLGKHYKDLAIVKNFEREPDHPALWQILRETAPQRDSRNIAPALSGQFARSVLTGTNYPRTLLAAIIARIRADNEINYIRAAMLKAYLIRNLKMEVTMSLDPNSNNLAYRLGRLFAVLEKAQEEAVPGANATVKDRFFGAASATPERIFPVLLRGVQNSISKLRKSTGTIGRAKYFDRLIAEIMDGIDSFRPTLSVEDQGMFAIGYYHQRKHLFTKKDAPESKEE